MDEDFYTKNENGEYVMKICHAGSDIVEEKDQQISADAISEGNYTKGRWSDEEHQLFLEALCKYGKDWDKI